MFNNQDEADNRLLRYAIVVTTADGSVHTVAVEDEPITIGRSPKATVCLPEEAVSRQHCMITPTHGRLALRDQGSTNGTRVNGKKVAYARLSHGDVVEVGGTKMRVQARTSPGWIPTAEGGAPSDSRAGVYPLLPHEQLGLLKRLNEQLAVTEETTLAGQFVLKAVLELLPAERALILLLEQKPEGPGYSRLAARWRAGVSQSDIPLDSVVIQRVVSTARVERHIVDPKKTQPDVGRDAGRLRMRPLICAPLRRLGTVFGLLYVDGASLPSWAGTGEMLALFSAVADVAAVALRHLSGGEPSPPLRPSQVRISRRTRSEPLSGPTLAQRELEPAVSQLAQSEAELIENQRIELAARLAELEHLQNARTVMVRGLVHDIRNLVGALEANLAFVRMGLAPRTEEASAMEAAMECSKRIVDLAENVIDMSRMEEGSFPLKTERVVLANLVSDVIRRHAGQAREAEVSLSLGHVDTDLALLADGNVMGRVLDNLVDNALRYAGTTGRVVVETSRRLRGVDIIVSDTGPGVAPEHRARIFEQWGQVEPVASKRHHGIGLHFCRLAVEAHGGSIHVEGERQNNRFVISLPLVDELEEHTLTTSTGSNPRSSEPGLF